MYVCVYCYTCSYKEAVPKLSSDHEYTYIEIIKYVHNYEIVAMCFYYVARHFIGTHKRPACSGMIY